MPFPIAKLAGLAAAFAMVFAAGLFWQHAQAPFDPPQQEQAVEVLFFGDLMLDRSVARRAAGDGAALVAGVVPLVAQADLVALNLEGTITQHESIAQRDNKILRFTFDPALTADVLRTLKADVVSLANNHALDFGPDGYAETVANLEQMGVGYFGHPLNSKNLSTTIERGGMVFCFVGYHDLFDAEIAAVVAEIQTIRPTCDRVIAMTHWGPEYRALPHDTQVAEAHALIDAGADLVVGGHPHVVQPYEEYRGKAIFYSLGNFVFDQDFSWATRHGLALTARFSPQETVYTLTPLAITESRPGVAQGPDAARVIVAAGGVDRIQLPVLR